MVFENITESLQGIGVFDFYIPFILMFSIFYGLLMKSKIFGDSTTNPQVRTINTLISFAAAMSVLLWLPLEGISLGEYFGTFFGQILVVFMTLLVFLLIISMSTPEGDNGIDFSSMLSYVVPVAFILALLVFTSSGGFEIFGIRMDSSQLRNLGISGEDLIAAVLILATAWVIMYITKGDTPKPDKKDEKNK